MQTLLANAAILHETAGKPASQKDPSNKERMLIVPRKSFPHLC
jgi:hypothetical protein